LQLILAENSDDCRSERLALQVASVIRSVETSRNIRG